MLDFFSRSVKTKSDPLADGASAKAYVDSLKKEFGLGAHDRVTEIMAELNEGSVPVSAGLVEAVLTLNLESHGLHETLCGQYVMNARIPKILEGQLRAQILSYGRQFLAFYQSVLSDGLDGSLASGQLPLILARMMHYRQEYARWQLLRHFSPDEGFWLEVHKLYQFAERQAMEASPVFLFGEQGVATTVQDQYLIMLMLTLLDSGNLPMRQVNFAYELLTLVSNRMSITASFASNSSFVVLLSEDKPARRADARFSGADARFWSTAEVVEILHGWALVLEGGRVPAEIKRLIEPGIDASLLRLLCREWAPKPMLFQRAERISVKDRKIEVTHRLPVLHKLIRQPDEIALQHQNRQAATETFDDAANIRIYGFITNRKRDRSPLGPASADAIIAPVQEKFPEWELSNISQTGLGVSLGAVGNEWVGLGHLIGFRSSREAATWSLGMIRRLKHLPKERVYLGIETLSHRPVAAAIRPTDVRLIDPSLPEDQVWQGGHIALFVPFNRQGKSINTLIMPVSVYMLGKQFYMTAKGKHFQIALGKVLEKGSDWCMAEIELVRSLEHLPLGV